MRHMKVLVMGATGFIAGHAIQELLEHGYAVRGSVLPDAATARFSDGPRGTGELDRSLSVAF